MNGTACRIKDIINAISLTFLSSSASNDDSISSNQIYLRQNVRRIQMLNISLIIANCQFSTSVSISFAMSLRKVNDSDGL